MFRNHEESHAHSLETLNILYEYDDFMESVGSVVDLGCGSAGLDLEWWATRTTRDENPIPLNIRCTGVDTIEKVSFIRKYNNITYQRTDFEVGVIPTKDTKFDVLWSHDSFQYAIDPIKTLAHWQEIANQDAMLVLILPQTFDLEYRQLSITQQSGCYHHYSLVSLIHMLAVTGWDCSAGFFLKRPADPWLHAVAYKSSHAPMDLRTTTWYDLAERGLLPKSAAECVQRRGYLDQKDLLLPWLDQSLTWYGQY